MYPERCRKGSASGHAIQQQVEAINNELLKGQSSSPIQVTIPIFPTVVEKGLQAEQ